MEAMPLSYHAEHFHAAAPLLESEGHTLWVSNTMFLPPTKRSKNEQTKRGMARKHLDVELLWCEVCVRDDELAQQRKLRHSEREVKERENMK